MLNQVEHAASESPPRSADQQPVEQQTTFALALAAHRTTLVGVLDKYDLDLVHLRPFHYAQRFLVVTAGLVAEIWIRH